MKKNKLDLLIFTVVPVVIMIIGLIASFTGLFLHYMDFMGMGLIFIVAGAIYLYCFKIKNPKDWEQLGTRLDTVVEEVVKRFSELKKVTALAQPSLEQALPVNIDPPITKPDSVTPQKDFWTTINELEKKCIGNENALTAFEEGLKKLGYSCKISNKISDGGKEITVTKPGTNASKVFSKESFFPDKKKNLSAIKNTA